MASAAAAATTAPSRSGRGGVRVTEDDLALQRAAAAARRKVLGGVAAVEAPPLGPVDASLREAYDSMLQRMGRIEHLEGVQSRYKGF